MIAFAHHKWYSTALLI